MILFSCLKHLCFKLLFAGHHNVMLKVNFGSRRRDFALLQCIRSKLLLIAQELYLCHLHQHLHPTAIAFYLISHTHMIYYSI